MAIYVKKCKESYSGCADQSLTALEDQGSHLVVANLI